MMDNKDALNYLKTARGQLDSTIQMIDDNRYCIDVSNQLLAVLSLIKKANATILTNHLHGCIKNSDKDTIDDKLEELSSVLMKLSK